MNTKYILGKIISLPLLPIIYFQAKRLRANFPSLPEATGTEGTVFFSSKKKLSILTIGESTIAGVGVNTHEEGFTGTLAKTLSVNLEMNINWKVYAKSGYNTRKIKERIVPEIREKQVDLIVIGLGGNDSFELNSLRNWKTQIQQLINKLRVRFKNTPIVFANMPPIREFPAFTRTMQFVSGNLVEIFGDELEKLVMDQKNVFFYSQKIILNEWKNRLNVAGDRSDFFSDGLHPSKLTYQVWGKDLANFIIEQKIIPSNNKT